jgi:tRNA(Ile)-lysidine synthase
LGPGPLCLGLSGGGDSTALLHVLARHFPDRRRVALIVDHGVQAGAAAVAQAAAEAARASGAEAIILRLARAGSGQARWRAARFGALLDAVRAAGGDRLILAHTRDDQAETVLMRARRGSFWRGLAGMAALAPAPAWPEGRGLWIVRPMLGARRADLRAFLRGLDMPWHDDPANADPRFDRPRLRAELAAAPAVTARLCDLAAHFAAACAAEDRAVAAALTDRTIAATGALAVPLAAWRGLGGSARRRFLAVAAGAAGGGARLPSGAKLAGLSAALADGAKAATLAGAWVRVRGAALHFGRDPGGVSGRSGRPGLVRRVFVQDGVWDGRFAIRPLGETVAVTPGADASPVADGPAEMRPLTEERLNRELWRAFTAP